MSSQPSAIIPASGICDVQHLTTGQLKVHDPIKVGRFYDRTAGKGFLSLHNAHEIEEVSTNTFSSKVYAVYTMNGREIWVEHESKLESPEYYYQLFRR